RLVAGKAGLWRGVKCVTCILASAGPATLRVEEIANCFLRTADERPLAQFKSVAATRRKRSNFARTLFESDPQTQPDPACPPLARSPACALGEVEAPSAVAGPDRLLCLRWPVPDAALRRAAAYRRLS